MACSWAISSICGMPASPPGVFDAVGPTALTVMPNSATSADDHPVADDGDAAIVRWFQTAALSAWFCESQVP